MLKKVKSGFSLVELSLVLIIVALIISAVVSGKSLVTNSKLTMLHSEMQTLKIALGNYINDNQKSSFLAGTDIMLYDLMNDGYLEDKTVVNYDGNEITSSSAKKSEKVIFKSKYSGGAWQYAGTAEDIIVNFGKVQKTDGALSALLPEVMVKNFQKKYEKAGSITITDATADTSILEATFLDGAQN